MLSSLLKFFLVGLVAVVVIGIALAVIGVVFSVVFGIATFLLFKVAPIVLLGYLVVKFLAPRRKPVAAGTQEWLDEG